MTVVSTKYAAPGFLIPANATLTSPTLITPIISGLVITDPVFVDESIVITANNYPLVSPSLNLDFANSQTVDPRISFTRSSTATRVNSKGLIESVASGVPRIDFDPVTLECKGLLIEEARTNLVPYSEQFDNAAWSAAATTVTANAVTAPDGSLTADKLIETVVAAYHTRWVAASFTSGLSYTLSIFAKAGERSLLSITAGNATTILARATFDLSSGLVASAQLGTAEIKSVGSGWYRCSVTGVAEATASMVCTFALSNATTYTSYTGDGTSGLYIWGAQLEAGAFPTSYIPTTTAAVTRTAEAATISGTNFSSWFTPNEFTLFVSASVPAYNKTALEIHKLATIDSGSTVDSAQIRCYSASGSLYFDAVIYASSVMQSDFLDGAFGTANTVVNTALSVAPNNATFSRNGSAAENDTSVTVPSNFSRIYFGEKNSHTRQVRVYPKALTAANLQALSTQ